MMVKKRSGDSVSFDADKIYSAVAKAFDDDLQEGDPAFIANITSEVSSKVVDGNCVEDIQDLVEKELMLSGYHGVAKKYILYRDKKKSLRSRSESRDKSAFDDAARYFQTPSQMYQFYSKYARWNSEKKRRETWTESVGRVMTFFQSKVDLPESDWDRLTDSMVNMRAVPAQRILQMAGPALDRCNSGAYNCSAAGINSLASFVEALYLLMQGCGFGGSVEEEYVHRLPGIRKQKRNQVVPVYVVQDSTEGWCDAYLVGLKAWFGGTDVTFDYSLVRPAGSRVVTKGGTSSGHEPLKSLLDFARSKILARQGSRLRPIDCHDILCKSGQIVHVGSTRRSAIIDLFDPDDEDMRDSKKGTFWNDNDQRFMSNNSAVFEETPTSKEFLRLWTELAESGTGEPGIVNRTAMLKNSPKRRKKVRFVTNPCAEIILRGDGGLCNLSIVIARHEDTPESLEEKVITATIFGTIQSTLTQFSSYLRPIWEFNANEERLLGVDITGQMDCPILRPGAAGREKLLEHLVEVARRVNVEYAAKLGINPSVAVTTVKPSGNSAVLYDCSSGIHPRHAPYYIRRFRAGRLDPLTQMMIDAGVPWFPEVNQTRDKCSVVVFEFPIKSPEGAITKDDVSAIDMLDNWLVWKKHWAEHTVSITCSVGEDEWMKAGNWVFDHWDDVTGIAFLPRDGGIYQLAPYEEITKEEYDKRNCEFPVIDFSKLSYYETVDTTEFTGELACTSATGCEI